MLWSLRATTLRKKKSVFFSIMGTEHGLLVLHLYSDFYTERIKFVPCYGEETRSVHCRGGYISSDSWECYAGTPKESLYQNTKILFSSLERERKTQVVYAMDLCWQSICFHVLFPNDKDKVLAGNGSPMSFLPYGLWYVSSINCGYRWDIASQAGHKKLCYGQILIISLVVCHNLEFFSSICSKQL